MSFGLDEDRTAIREMALGFAAEHIAPHALDWDRDKTFPVETLREAAALGMAGIYVREDVGGSGLSRLDATLIFEALSTGCPTVAAFLSIHNMVRLDDRRLRRRRPAPPLAPRPDAAWSGSPATASPNRARARTPRRSAPAPSGTATITCSTARSSSSPAPVPATSTSCMVRTGEAGPAGISAIVVEKGTPGLSFGADERKMGWNAQPTRAVRFDELPRAGGQPPGRRRARASASP